MSYIPYKLLIRLQYTVFQSFKWSTLNSSENDKSGISVDAAAPSGEETVSNAEASGSDPQKSLELANELMEKGNKAIKENDFGEAADNFSRALEIRFL